MVTATIPDGQYGDLYSILSDTTERLANMKKNLLFQPAYFSGSKVDFRNKMKFLEKLTKPAKNQSSKTAFNFITPPICVLQLGDWVDHYVVFDSVDYNYLENSWTLDVENNEIGMPSGVQPLMAQVTLSFKILGKFGASLGYQGSLAPPLADDAGGFFGISPAVRSYQEVEDAIDKLGQEVLQTGYQNAMEEDEFDLPPE